MTILKSLVGFPQKGECDLGKLLLQEFLFLSIHKAVLIFSQWPLSFLRYFGANTMWYLQFHFECAKLFMSLRPMFSSFLEYAVGRPHLCSNFRRISGQTHSVHGTPRLTRGFLYTKRRRMKSSLICTQNPGHIDLWTRLNTWMLPCTLQEASILFLIESGHCCNNLYIP